MSLLSFIANELGEKELHYYHKQRIRTALQKPVLNKRFVKAYYIRICQNRQIWSIMVVLLSSGTDRGALYMCQLKCALERQWIDDVISGSLMLIDTNGGIGLVQIW